ncbi:amino acid permease 2-like isoform X2 [Magnolia sinica]|uniref:amino acid permease 2-like isoform X2 n=1 Tax=Magnolia sinica TaxID=86752 RepID=UPI002659ACDE|nr:amino acid permease 2-like isoform X2 [Magnolia sinica]
MEWEMELKIAKMNGSEVQPQSPSLCSDDNGCIKRTGNVWTTSARIITAVISSGLPFLAWAIAQLGWIAGPTVMFLFSLVFYYTASLLADCYQSGDPVTGKRNNTYSDAVRANLGGVKVKICGVIEYLYLFGVAIGYTVTASISMMAIKRSNCFHKSGGKHPCQLSSNHYMIMFGISEIIFCQIPIINQIFCLSVVTAVMSFTYSSIGLGLGIARVAARSSFKGSLTGISIGTVTQTQKIWRSFQALGDIASAYSHLTILIKIQFIQNGVPILTEHHRIPTFGVQNHEEGNPPQHHHHNGLQNALRLHGLRFVWGPHSQHPPLWLWLPQPLLASRHRQCGTHHPPCQCLPALLPAPARIRREVGNSKIPQQ